MARTSTRKLYSWLAVDKNGEVCLDTKLPPLPRGWQQCLDLKSGMMSVKEMDMEMEMQSHGLMLNQKSNYYEIKRLIKEEDDSTENNRSAQKKRRVMVSSDQNDDDDALSLKLTLSLPSTHYYNSDEKCPISPSSTSSSSSSNLVSKQDHQNSITQVINQVNYSVSLVDSNCLASASNDTLQGDNRSDSPRSDTNCANWNANRYRLDSNCADRNSNQLRLGANWDRIDSNREKFNANFPAPDANHLEIDSNLGQLNSNCVKSDSDQSILGADFPKSETNRPQSSKKYSRLETNYSKSKRNCGLLEYNYSQLETNWTNTNSGLMTNKPLLMTDSDSKSEANHSGSEPNYSQLEANWAANLFQIGPKLSKMTRWDPQLLMEVHPNPNVKKIMASPSIGASGCPKCFMYVLMSNKSNPRCPKCGSSIFVNLDLPPTTTKFLRA